MTPPPTPSTTLAPSDPTGNGQAAPAAAGGGLTTTVPPVEHKRLYATWRVAAHRRLVGLLGRLDDLPAEDSQRGGVTSDLTRAARAFEDTTWRTWRTGLAEDQVHAALDEAEVRLIPSDDAELQALVPGLRSRLTRRFQARDSRRVTALALLKGDPDRSAVAGAFDLLHAGSADLRATQLARRNRTGLVTLLVACATLGVATVLDHQVGAISLARPGVKGDVGADPWVVVLFGTVGGLLSVLPMLRRAGTVTRAGAAWGIQALLKITLGGLVGLLGAWLVQRGVLDLTEPQDASALSAWALVFGYSQDAVTRKLDERLAATKPPAAADATEDGEDS